MWYVCFLLWITSVWARCPSLGPPGQVAAVAGKKDGGNQGEIGGILKELNYSSDQASAMKFPKRSY